MEKIKEYSNSEFVFDNTKTTSSVEKIKLNGETITVDYNSIIDTQFSGGNTGQEFEHLKAFLGLGIYSKAPCGGFVNFYALTGDRGNDYILFTGINEVSNSHYIVTIHQILKK